MKPSKILIAILLPGLFALSAPAQALLFSTSINSSATFDGVTQSAVDGTSSSTGTSTPGVSTQVSVPANATGNQDFSSAQAVANSGLNGLKVFADAQFVDSTPLAAGATSASSSASASLVIADLLITPTAGSNLSTVTGDLNLHVSGGFLNFSNWAGLSTTSTASITGAINGTAIAGSMTLDCQNAGVCSTTSNGFLAGVALGLGSSFAPQTPSMTGNYVAATLTLPVGTPVSLSLTMMASVSINDAATSAPFSGLLNAESQIDFRNTVAFPTNSAVLGLPAGFTANSGSGGIQNNIFTGNQSLGSVPLPGSVWLLLAGGAVLFAARRRRY